MDKRYDTIVLGLGAMGSAALYQLSKKTGNVLGIDQYAPPHKLGSTHGDTRITRQAIGEGEQYVPLALRSYEIWDELEMLSGNKLLYRNGGLLLGSIEGPPVRGRKDFIRQTIDIAKKCNIEHEVLSTEDIEQRFPQFKVQEHEIGYYEKNAGFLKPEACIETQLDLAKKNGAQVNINEKVLSFTQEGDVVKVVTDRGEYLADKLIVSAGPWVSQFFPEYADLFKIYRQVLYWFDVENSYEQYRTENFPIFIWDFGNGEDIYGFPAIDGATGGIKIALEDYSINTTPEKVERTVSIEETMRMYDKFVKNYLNGVTDKCLKSISCLYTVTPDADFIIDTHPTKDRIILASPCSGHGFKHSSAVGEILAQLAIDGKTTIDISKFSLSRFK